MSKIFDAVTRAELLHAGREDYKTAGTAIAEGTDRRGSARIYVHIPLFIYGYTAAGDPFYEETYTISINGAGGLISMMTRSVEPGQELVVTNRGNDQTQTCVVVSVESWLTYGSSIALKFSAPMPQFWRELEIGNSPLT